MRSPTDPPPDQHAGPPTADPGFHPGAALPPMDVNGAEFGGGSWCLEGAATA